MQFCYGYAVFRESILKQKRFVRQFSFRLFHYSTNMIEVIIDYIDECVTVLRSEAYDFLLLFVSILGEVGVFLQQEIKRRDARDAQLVIILQDTIDMISARFAADDGAHDGPGDA